MASKNKPSANLTGELGSFLPKRIQIEAITGANSTIKIAFKDWNQVVGTSKEPTMRSVNSFVNKFIKPPACSKPAQKIIVNKPITMMTLIRSRSTLVSGSLRSSPFSSAFCFSSLAAGTVPMSPKYFCANKN